MLGRVVDYVHVERGIIPRDHCKQTLAVIENADWTPNQWHNPVKNETFSDEREPDMLFATPESNALLAPAILKAVQNYINSHAHDASSRTKSIVTRFSYVRFNRYRAGQGMAIHVDHIHSLFDGEQKGIPVLSFVGNLNEDYEGGDLAFFGGEHSVALKTGDICIFPSCFLYPHQAQEVTRGTRYSFAAWGW